MRIFIAIVFFACLLTGVSGCARRRVIFDAAANTRWLRWAMAREPLSLDWTTCADRSCLATSMLVMEGLAGIENKAGALTATPVLAKSWEFTSPTKLTINLRSDIKWSDGSTLVASDFLYSWEKVLRQCRSLSTASLLFPIENASAYCGHLVPFSAVGFKAPDAHTLVLSFHEARAQFPLILSLPLMWPSRPPAVGHLALTLGKFTLQSAGHGQMRFIRNPFYYNDSVKIAGIIARVVESAPLRVLFFLEGETDFVDEVPYSMLNLLGENPSLHSDPTDTVMALLFNTARRPFSQLTARQAFEQAIHREEMTSLMRWSFQITDYLLPIGTGPSLAAIGFSAANAQGLLPRNRFDFENERTFENGQWHVMAHPTLSFPSRELCLEVAENLQAQWLKNLEVKVDLVPVNKRDSSYASSLTLLPVRVDPFDPLKAMESLANKAHWKMRIEEKSPNEVITEPLSAIADVEQRLIVKDAIVFPLFNEAHATLTRGGAENLRAAVVESLRVTAAASE